MFAISSLSNLNQHILKENNLETSLTVNDLATVVNIIDVCVERGAFKGNEMLNVGQLREKFAAVVNANKPKIEETEAETGE